MWCDEDEIAAMTAIYGSDFSCGESSSTVKTNGICVKFFYDSAVPAVTCPWLSRDECAQLVEDLPSELFGAISEILARLPEKSNASEEKLRSEPEEQLDMEFVQSEPLKDRKSKFVGFAAKVYTREEAHRFVRSVQRRTQG
jgi:hypothetical protein